MGRRKEESRVLRKSQSRGEGGALPQHRVMVMGGGGSGLALAKEIPGGCPPVEAPLAGSSLVQPLRLGAHQEDAQADEDHTGGHDSDEDLEGEHHLFCLLAGSSLVTCKPGETASMLHILQGPTCQTEYVGPKAPQKGPLSRGHPYLTRGVMGP